MTNMCIVCKPDLMGNCPCDYGFPCPHAFIPSTEGEEEEEPP